MLKRLISLSLAVLLVLSCALPASAAKTGNKSGASVLPMQETEAGDYRFYQTANAALSNAKESIEVKVPENTELKQSGDTVTLTFTVAEAGWYEPQITYYATEGTGGDVLFSLLLDGLQPYSQLNNLRLSRMWQNSTNEFQSDEDGNQYSPEQVEVFNWQTAGLYDSEGFITEPLCLALTEGEHTITIRLNSECMKVGGLTLSAPEKLLSYEEYKKLHSGSAYQGGKLIYEGELADIKSQKMYIPMSARNDADVSPADPAKKLNNYIGGSNWNGEMGTITWNIDVPSDGYYQLGFHFRQTYLQEANSYRALLIDGQIPFREAAAVAFGYKSGWQYMTLNDAQGNAMPVYLTAGPHTIGLRVTLGDLSEFASQLQSVTARLGVIYRQIVKITGETPDANRDYALFTALPGLGEELTDISEKLEELALLSESVSGAQGGTNAATLRKAKVIIDQMLKKKFEAHTKLKTFYDNYSSLSSWLYEMQNMALDLDNIMLMAPGDDFADVKVGFWAKLVFLFQRLWASFTTDESLGEADENTIVIWSNWGRDQLTVLENLIANDFTPRTGIKVEIKITAAGAVQGKLSGNGPDVEINVGRNAPVDYAMRGILTDLSQFEDFAEVADRFSKTALTPYQYNGGVYGLPNTETYSMLFVRTDIFEELGIEVPETWDEFIDCAKIINLNNMNCGMPQIGNTFLTQMGVPVYKEDLSATNLMSAGAVSAYTYWTDFYTKYGFPKTYDFFNRFRTGLMPMGIADFSVYATLKAAAPEINGKWKMCQMPGFLQEDGTINNAVTGAGTACVILNWSQKQDKAWEFLKWWTSDDIQYRFGVNLESVLGMSGRYETANLNALYRLGWEAENLEALIAQGQKLQQIPEVPGGYYVGRSTQQVYWNVVNNGQKVEDMLKKWIPEADDEIRRKTEEYAKGKE